MLSCADRLATRGAGPGAVDRGAPGAGARGDGAPRCAGARDGPPRPPLAATSWRASWASSPGPSSASCSRELEAAVYAGRGVDPRPGRALTPAGCARIAGDDRRLRRVRGRGAPRRRSWSCATPSRRCRDNDAFVWIGLLRARPRRSSTRSRASSTCTSWRSRTPSTPTSGPSSRCTATRSSWCSRRRATWTREEVVEFGEILVFIGEDFIVTVRHGEATDLHDVREQVEADPEHLGAGPGAVLHAIVDRVVDDYVPAIEGLRADIEEVENDVFSRRPAQLAPSASTSSSARCSSSTAPPTPLVEPDEPPRRRAATTWCHPEVQGVLPRRERPPGAGAASSSRASASC